jgi:hypothetical protein
MIFLDSTGNARDEGWTDFPHLQLTAIILWSDLETVSLRFV